MSGIENIKKKYKNYTNGTKQITTFLNEQDLNVAFNDENIELLLKQHPNENKVQNIEYLIVRIRPPYNKRALFIKNFNASSEDDVSYKYCLRSLYGLYDSKKNNMSRILSAFRDSTFETRKINFFYNQNISYGVNNEYIGLCANCKTESKINVDHYEIPFKKIFDDFLKNNTEVIVEYINVFENEKKCYEFTDITLKDKWVNYHDKIATYRLLCNTCNSSLGTYGYKNPNPAIC
jgi:hypothetical protein